MECHQLKSVVSLVDSLVRSAHARRSRVPTDFSICSILGLGNEVTLSSSSSDCHSDTSPPLSPYSDCTSPRPNYRGTSPLLTPYSDITSSSSDCDSEPDQVPTHSEQLPRKKRQRTTFSPNEVWELELVFRRRPYLIDEDEEDLVQRLGITAKSVRYWFQNRRAKSRRLERKSTTVYQPSPSSQFGLPVCRAALPRRLQFVNRSPSEHWTQGKRVSCPAVQNFQPYGRPITPVDSRQSSVKSNQFKGEHSFPLPMFHPDQFKTRPAEPARLSHVRSSRRFQPY